MRTASLVLALVAALWSVWVLEGARQGITITQGAVGATPVTRYSDGSGGPPVVIAHGFAGSRQMMQGYALTLAQAGYTVHAFDFEGHGRHRTPMSGDVNAIEGTTQRLVNQTRAVIDAARQGDRPVSPPVALLGHSMATDVLVRVAQDAAGNGVGTGPLVLLSAFSQEITATHPQSLLLITGVWEPGLREFALAAAQMVDPSAVDGQTVQADGTTRQALLAPAVEHVAILHSRAGRAAARDWLDSFYQRPAGAAAVPPTGWALLALLAAITALAAPLARLLPQAGRAQGAQPRLGGGGFAAATLVPMIAAPLLSAPIDTRLLPVLVADALALHLLVYGLIQGAILWWLRGAPGRPSGLAVAALVVWGLGAFGLALDRYGANFLPTPDRLWIIAALAIGAVPFMLADAWAAQGAPLWQRVLARVAVLVSLGIAVALDFEGMFFVLMIMPVILLFWLTFGLMGRFVAVRTGATSAGLGLGLILAWALGVSFPLFLS